MRFARFGMVGMVNTSVDFAVFNVLVMLFGASFLLANIVSYSAGLVNSWLLNSRWTFRDREGVYRSTTVPLFVASNIGGLLVNTAALAGLVALAALSGSAEVPSALTLNACKILALGLSLAWNYVAMDRLVFRRV